MKKSLLALAVLGAFTGVASAQSSVTLFGTIDLNARYVTNDGSSRRVSLGQDGLNSSQLGFRGVEDLGGGMKASFILLAGVNADTGTSNVTGPSSPNLTGTTTSKFWNRRSTVSLLGGFGEIRLGRDYTPTFWNQTIFDPFGTVGVGSSLNITQLYGGTRQDNSIGYFLPSKMMGGLYGQLMASAGESASAPGSLITEDRNGRYVGGRVGFAAGPFNIAVAYSQIEFNNQGLNDQDTYNIGGSYDLGVLKLVGYFNRDDNDVVRDNRFVVGAVVPLGQGEIHGSYGRSNLTGNGFDNKVQQLALGYVYNLSKRTAVYGNVSYLKNDDQSRNSVASRNSIAALPTFGGNSKGAEIGVRHFF